VSTLNLAGANEFLSIVNGRTWVNEGTLTLAEGYIRFGYGSGGANTLTNAAGATFNLTSTNATPLDYANGTATFNNAGTLNQSVAIAHAIHGNIAFNNTGTVNVDEGTLTLAGSGTHTGLFTAAAGATLEFAGGTQSLDAGSDVIGTGRVLHVAGQIGIPYYVIQGRHDLFSPTPLVEAYFNTVSAPKKRLIIIEEAGHFALATHQAEMIAALKAVIP
jgi:pimeloyl-ACP methyl ester carboxylesterase